MTTGDRRGTVRAASARAHSRATRVVLVGVLLAGTATADPTPAERERAARLFTDAKALMTEGRFRDACPMLVEAQRLDAGGGTLLALAMCHEGEGRVATALAEFRTARAWAERAKRADRVAVADERIAALAPRVPRLVVEVGPAVGPELTLTVDGTRVSRESAAEGVLVDGGAHTVRAEAPGRRPWQTTIETTPDSTIVRVRVPTLVEDAAAAPVAEAAQPVEPARRATHDPPRPRSSRETLGLAVGGVGVVVTGVGMYFGWKAIRLHRDSQDLCDGPACRTQEGVDLSDRAGRAATIATVTDAVGLALVGVGAYLILTREDPGSTAVRAVPLSIPCGAGLGVDARF